MTVSAEDRAACACIRVRQDILRHDDGTCSESWVCEAGCGSRFTRQSFAESLHATLRRVQATNAVLTSAAIKLFWELPATRAWTEGEAAIAEAVGWPDYDKIRALAAANQKETNVETKERCWHREDAHNCVLERGHSGPCRTEPVSAKAEPDIATEASAERAKAEPPPEAKPPRHRELVYLIAQKASVGLKAEEELRELDAIVAGAEPPPRLYDAALRVLHEHRHRVQGSRSGDERARLEPGLLYAIDALELREAALKDPGRAPQYRQAIEELGPKSAPEAAPDSSGPAQQRAAFEHAIVESLENAWYRAGAGPLPAVITWSALARALSWIPTPPPPEAAVGEPSDTAYRSWRAANPAITDPKACYYEGYNAGKASEAAAHAVTLGALERTRSDVREARAAMFRCIGSADDGQSLAELVSAVELECDSEHEQYVAASAQRAAAEKERDDAKSVLARVLDERDELVRYRTDLEHRLCSAKSELARVREELAKLRGMFLGGNGYEWPFIDGVHLALEHAPLSDAKRAELESARRSFFELMGWKNYKPVVPALREGRPEPDDHEVAHVLEDVLLADNFAPNREGTLRLARAAKTALLGVRRGPVVDREELAAEFVRGWRGRAWPGDLDAHERELILHGADAVLRLFAAPAPDVGKDSGAGDVAVRGAGTPHSVGSQPAEAAASPVSSSTEQPNEPPVPLPEVLPVGTRADAGGADVVSLGEARLERRAGLDPVYWAEWDTGKGFVHTDDIDWSHYRAQQPKPEPARFSLPPNHDRALRELDARLREVELQGRVTRRLVEESSNRDWYRDRVERIEREEREAAK